MMTRSEANQHAIAAKARRKELAIANLLQRAEQEITTSANIGYCTAEIFIESALADIDVLTAVVDNLKSLGYSVLLQPNSLDLGAYNIKISFT